MNIPNINFSINNENCHYLFENMNDGFCLLAIEINSNNKIDSIIIEYANNNLNNYFGFDFISLIGINLLDTDLLSNRNIIIEIAEVAITKIPKSGEYKSHISDLIIKYFAFPTDINRIGVIVSTKNDNINTSIHLKKSEETLTSILETIEQVIFSIDLNSNITYISNHTNLVYRISSQEFLDNPNLWFDIIVDEDKEKVSFHLKEMMETGFFSMDYRVKLRDGSIKWVHNKSKVVFADGKPQKVEGTVYDVTDTKTYELELERKNKLITSFFVDNPLYMGVVEIRNNFSEIVHISGNNNYKILVNKTRDIDYPWSVAYNESEDNHIHLWLEKYKEAFNKHHPVSFSFDYSDGENTAYFYAMVSFLNMNEENIPQFSFIIDDITEKKISEIKIQEYALKMEQKSLELEKEIEKNKSIQKELLQAKNVAELADRTKTEFLANMSHEIRTPMNAILGFAELIIDNEQDSKLLGYAKGIISGGKSLLSLINDILDLSKIESGNLTIHNDSIDVYRLCREIYHLFKLKANEKYLKFLHFISSDVPPYLIIDEVRIRQVLLNLISNAIKFTETGYILLIIDAEKNVQNPENYNLIFRIIDTGIGIPPEQQTIIFDAFRQMDGKSNRRFGGTGLGLTISKKLTELMNGNISLKSNPNDGSEFLIYLNNLKSSDIKDSTEFWINEIYSVTFNKCTLLAFVSQDTKNILDITFRGNDSSIIYVDSFTSLKLALESIHYDVVIVEDINSNQLSSEFVTEIQNINFDNLKLILISSDKRIAENTNILLNIESWISAPAKREQLLFELSKYIKFETKSNSLKYKEQILNDSSISDSSLEIVKCVIDNELSNFKDKFKIDIPIDEATHFGMLLINRGSSINNKELIEVGKKIIKTASNYDFEQLYRIIKTLFS